MYPLPIVALKMRLLKYPIGLCFFASFLPFSPLFSFCFHSPLSLNKSFFLLPLLNQLSCSLFHPTFLFFTITLPLYCALLFFLASFLCIFPVLIVPPPLIFLSLSFLLIIHALLSVSIIPHFLTPLTSALFYFELLWFFYLPFDFSILYSQSRPDP